MGQRDDDAPRTEQVNTPDGTFDGWLYLPPSGSGPGVLLLQEIFGVGEFLRAKARDLAAEGYVVLCPDVFWRVQRHVALGHDEQALGEAMALAGRYASEVPDETKAVDLVAALDHLRALPEVSSTVAAMGYCLGGTLAYRVAALGEPDACVSYYGSGIADQLDRVPDITCPVLFQFGGSDPFIPNDQVDAIREAFADRDDVEVVVEPDAGHAYENFAAEMFHDPAASKRSWVRTLAFLERALG